MATDLAIHLEKPLLNVERWAQLLLWVLLDHDRVEFLRVFAALLIEQTGSILNF